MVIKHYCFFYAIISHILFKIHPQFYSKMVLVEVIDEAKNKNLLLELKTQMDIILNILF